MTRKIFKIALALMCLLWIQSARAEGGATYTNEPASVVWPFNSADFATTVTTSPEGAFSVASFDQGVCRFPQKDGVDQVLLSGTTACPDVTFVRLQSVNGPSDQVKWFVKPAKGLTFTPTNISFYISRNGTDGGTETVSVQGQVVGSTEVVLFEKITPHRNNKTQSADLYGSEKSYTTKFEHALTDEQKQSLTSGEGFYLIMNNGYGNNKDCDYSDIQIHGTVSGSKEEVAKYALTLKSNIEGAGELSTNPAATEYEAGTEVKVAAAKNFGYAFVNWTDGAGNVVSTEPNFTYKVNAATELTANFNKLNTYELAYAVEGGANLYQVQPDPAGTMVDGKRMYEEGTTVTLTASSNPIVTFTNWNEGQSSSEITVTMDADHTDIVASFDAVDFVAGWDFYQSGSSGRPADFASDGNDDAAIVMRDAEGNSTSWLDKSQVAAGGYEGRPGAVNWKTDGLGKYYWQMAVNAEAFTDLKVVTAMVYNYNAYTTYDVEYSLDDASWTKIGTITMEGAKKWTDGEFTLPAAADNQPKVYVRIKADTTSDKDGTTSNNDGACLGATYILGTAKLVNDGTAPVLTATVPAEGADNASVNGKIVLTFDEKVKVNDGAVATLGSKTLEPTVTGKTVMFRYNNLSYSTAYTFTLPAGSVADLTDNALNETITIRFTTKTRPAAEKVAYDVVVSTADELAAAINEANGRADNTKRFRIFIHDGFYRLPASTTATVIGSDGVTYPCPTTYISAPNISFIGESRDGVIITNTVPDILVDNGYGPANVLEGLGKSDVICINSSAKNTYFQDLTIKSAMGDAHGRDCELEDKGDKTILKNVYLYGYQDTYYSHNTSRFYFEGGVIRGRTDYLCGSGDVYCNGVTLLNAGAGYVTAPSTPRQYGYIFKDCEITGETSDIDGKYTLGRPWGSGTPVCLWIDTKMTCKPSAAGWNEMSGGYPKRFAEYNSTTATGTVIDLANRKKSFGDENKNGIFANDPVLTKAEAEYYSYERVMGGDDNWDPASDAEQAPLPENVKLEGDNVIAWDECIYASMWAVCVDGKALYFTTEPAFTLPANAPAGHYSVRAANAMGGLGEAVAVGHVQTGIVAVEADSEVVGSVYYNMQGLRVNANTPGVLIRVDTLASGKTVTTKIVK